SEQRRLARMSERERETTCFACRQKGHSARDCPNALEGDLLVDGVRTMTGKDTVNICYRCGSPTHSLTQCRTPLNKANPMPFASCFVCLGKGHLAGKCPKNAAKGVYPEGGECKICRGKDHLARDCSLRRDEQIATTLLPHPNQSTTSTDSQDLEGPIGADEDDFHVLKRKRYEVELEEQAEEEATRKRKLPRPAAELKKLAGGAGGKRKVVAF
ncbi:hypothetical protein BDY24DRAFT_344410, partial [Mrakia frigida]|uniref:uncharacterized protein n=1 Tax=Mrakia frigida TaxID=29902 RepID=UPI003FCC0C36